MALAFGFMGPKPSFYLFWNIIGEHVGINRWSLHKLERVEHQSIWQGYEFIFVQVLLSILFAAKTDGKN